MSRLVAILAVVGSSLVDGRGFECAAAPCELSSFGCCLITPSEDDDCEADVAHLNGHFGSSFVCDKFLDGTFGPYLGGVDQDACVASIAAADAVINTEEAVCQSNSIDDHHLTFPCELGSFCNVFSCDEDTLCQAVAGRMNALLDVETTTFIAATITTTTKTVSTTTSSTTTTTTSTLESSSSSSTTTSSASSSTTTTSTSSTSSLAKSDAPVQDGADGVVGLSNNSALANRSDGVDLGPSPRNKTNSIGGPQTTTTTAIGRNSPNVRRCLTICLVLRALLLCFGFHGVGL